MIFPNWLSIETDSGISEIQYIETVDITIEPLLIEVSVSCEELDLNIISSIIQLEIEQDIINMEII